MTPVTRQRKVKELYSAKKYSTKGVELSSVINPATSSLSASGRSKGVREVSASAEIKKRGRAGKIRSHVGRHSPVSHKKV